MGYLDVKRGNAVKKSKVLAVINQKGGVGKSTTVVNLAAALGDAKKKVLVIDIDPQGNTTSGLGLDKYDLKKSIYQALIGECAVQDVIADTCEPRVFIIPATSDLAGAEIELVEIERREHKLQDLVTQMREHFDYLIIDCPPSLGLLTVNALVAADALIIPIQCEYYALEGVSELMKSMKMIKGGLNPYLDIFGVLLTMYDNRTTLSKQVAQEVTKFFGNKVFKTIIPRNVKLSEAPSHGIPVTRYARISKGAQAYMKLAKEVIRRG